MAMCDRIGVMSAGRLVAVFERGEWSEQSLLAAAFSDATGRAATPPTTASATPASNPVTADTQ
jgi:ribose transport system ATP-binding protein